MLVALDLCRLGPRHLSTDDLCRGTAESKVVLAQSIAASEMAPSIPWNGYFWVAGEAKRCTGPVQMSCKSTLVQKDYTPVGR